MDKKGRLFILGPVLAVVAILIKIRMPGSLFSSLWLFLPDGSG